MDFTFGIITDGSNNERLHKIIDSIESMKIDTYEIIIIGGGNIERNNTTSIIFEDEFPFKISKKKNLITLNSKFDNIVYLHDYIEFDEKWYENFLEFGDDFQVCLTPILNLDGTRYRDWCLWKDDADNYVTPPNYLIPYDMTHLSGMMYVSGAYWIAKRKFMLENLMNEKLNWGQGEDVEWSLRARDLTEFKMNIKSIVKLLKKKERIFNETTEGENKSLLSIKNYKKETAYQDLIKNHLSQWIK